MSNDPRDGDPLDETVAIVLNESAMTVDLEATRQRPKPLAQVAVDQTVLDPAPLDETMVLPVVRQVPTQEPDPSLDQSHTVVLPVARQVPAQEPAPSLDQSHTVILPVAGRVPAEEPAASLEQSHTVVLPIAGRVQAQEPAASPDQSHTVALPVAGRVPVQEPAASPEQLHTVVLPVVGQVPTQILAPSPEQSHIATVLGGPLAPTVAVGPAVVWAPYEPVPEEGAEPLGELSPGEYLHFGPGVPAPSVSTTGHAGEIWRGDVPAAEEPRRRRWLLGGWLLPIIVLIVVLAILAWMRFGHPIAVTGAQAHAQSTTIGCGDTATITGTLQTNGEAGTVSYQWQRSDGTQSAVLQQRFAKGTHQVNVALLWTFSGDGNIHATATLDVLTPNAVSASTSFTYTCE
jgi:hypothetical protein